MVAYEVVHFSCTQIIPMCMYYCERFSIVDKQLSTLCDFFPMFLSKPPRLSLEMKRFASVEDSLVFSVLCAIFRKCFFLFLVGGKGISESYRA